MQDLSKTSGLPLKLDTKKHSLVFGKELTNPTFVSKCLADMREVLAQKDLTSPEELYYEYKGMCKTKDVKEINQNKLRYSITVIRPDRLGAEYMKTAGCYICGSGAMLYEVLSPGAAWFILQKPGKKDICVIDDVILLKAFSGEKIIIPPGYGYVIINIANEHLVISSWTSSEIAYECDSYRKTKGAAYFVFEDNLGERFEVNPFYKDVPNMRVARPAKTIKKFGLKIGVPMYALLSSEVSRLCFLSDSLKYDYSDVFVFD